MVKLRKRSKFYMAQVPKAIMACFASLPIAITSFGFVYLCCGMDLFVFDKFYSDIISNLTLSTILTQKVFKERSTWLHQYNFPLKYFLISIIVVVIGASAFAIELFFITRYFDQNMKIIGQHSYWFTFIVMGSLYFFDHQVFKDSYVVKIIFWYLISWFFYYIANPDIPLAIVRTIIYIFFFRHHILKFMPTEMLTSTNRIVIFAIFLVIDTILFEELAKLTAENPTIANTRTAHYQSHLCYGFTVANNYVLLPLQEKVLKNKKFLGVYILAAYGWGLLLGSITFLLYHFVFFPYFFSVVISNTYPSNDSLFVAGSLSWIDRVYFVQILVYDVASKNHPPEGLIIVDLEYLHQEEKSKQKGRDINAESIYDTCETTIETYETDPINDYEIGIYIR